MKFSIRFFALFVFTLLLQAKAAKAQNIFLTPYQGLALESHSKVNMLSFSNNSKMLAIVDEKGLVTLWDVDNNTRLKQIPVSDKVTFISFLEEDKKLLIVSGSGNILQYTTSDFSQLNIAKAMGKPKLVNLDPTGQTLVLLSVNDQIELFDLKANLSQAKIQVPESAKKPMFVGYDRFGQQLLMITELGKALSWNPLNQKFLRELTLQSGEYSGSRSILHSASTNTLGDRFVIGLQEVFIPKGGMQGHNQPERRNMIVTYDWLSGSEVKRVPTRYRVDEMTFGPGAGHVAYFSKDANQVWMVNLDRAEITSSVTLPEVPACVEISENKEYLAVGTEKGRVNIYYIERNTPAEIKILNPSLDRSYAEQIIKNDKAQIKGTIEGAERINKVLINDQEATLDFSGGFSGDISLVPGKNKVRIAAQNTEMKSIIKDFYVTYAPEQKQTTKHAEKITTRRVALVIGNATYQYGNKLNNTLNDASSIASTFKELGFDVISILDGNYETMKNAIYAFGDRIQDVDVSVFYYAGHGIEVDGTNYLVPVDADIQSPLDIKLKTIPLPGVLKTMEITNHEGLNMIILDACRNNPFPSGKRGGSGLAKVNAPSGTLIAYATDPGAVASDGAGSNGLYTGELVKQLKIQQRIEDVFMNTRNHVEEISKGTQRPWEEARLKGVFYLK